MGLILLLLIFALVFALFRRLLQAEDELQGPGRPSRPAPTPVPRRDLFRGPSSDDPNEAARRSGSWG